MGREAYVRNQQGLAMLPSVTEVRIAKCAMRYGEMLKNKFNFTNEGEHELQHELQQHKITWAKINHIRLSWKPSKYID